MLLALTAQAQKKREFRGAWIQCVNGQFKGMPTLDMQKTLAYQLDELKKDGCNAIIFQVRPECDALYESKLEPWSYYLTGEQGKAPQPYWDPLQWMIDQCHKRGMELHAWINPYRAKTKVAHTNSPGHVVSRHPERCFDYDGLTLLNPALKENRDYICAVVMDIVERYDIDGLHMDDYFYPYPTPGVEIPDTADFEANNEGYTDIGDWRRHNVDLFVEQLAETVHNTKPWVKVGISPFGIYRNQKSHPKGSRTNGLQNYDQLYADILLWDKNRWMDYCVPQLYWEIGNKAADYDELIHWWNDNCHNTNLYIGEDVERTVKYQHMADKMALHAEMEHVQGVVLWYAKAVVDNVGNYGTFLRDYYWHYPALQPAMPFIDGKAPRKVKGLKPVWTSDGYMLFWRAPKGKGWKDEAVKYVVYRFGAKEKVNTADATKIIAITPQTFLKLPYDNGKTRYTYVVTALDRLQNESKVVKKTVKL
jgi:uncharacterized lipoprotein YddW (UPF0748 family)